MIAGSCISTREIALVEISTTCITVFLLEVIIRIANIFKILISNFLRTMRRNTTIVNYTISACK